MSDNGNEAEEEMARAIFISNDCWLSVFDWLSPRQLGLEIALFSHRFDIYVSEHFKTRKWALKSFEILRKIGENGSKEMKIVNYTGKELPIPQNPLPKKVVGFEAISIGYIDQNVIVFLRRFRRLFAAYKINLSIDTTNVSILDFIWSNIWPLLGENIHGLELTVGIFHLLRHFAPSILNECPSLRIVKFYGANFFPEFPPADENAAASDGQSVAKWLFTPLQNNVPKVLKCLLDMDHGNLAPNMEAFKAAFASASSPVNFIVTIRFPPSFAASVVPFDHTNELTREKLTLERINNGRRFLLIRCPIGRDESKWTKWEKEAFNWQMYDQRNRINIEIYNEDDIGDWIVDEIPDPSVLQQT